MARKARKPKAKARRRRPSPDRVLDAALALAAARGWKGLGLADVAREAGAALDEVRALYPTRGALLRAFLRRTDERVLAHGPAEGTSARDRLFEVLMRRFDALEPDRDAVRAVVRDACCDPAAALCRLPALLMSMAWMLEAAGIGSSGPMGALRVKGLAVVYLATLRVWIADDSADRAKTMAALDRALRRAETVATALCPGRPADAAA